MVMSPASIKHTPDRPGTTRNKRNKVPGVMLDTSKLDNSDGRPLSGTAREEEIAKAQRQQN